MNPPIKTPNTGPKISARGWRIFLGILTAVHLAATPAAWANLGSATIFAVQTGGAAANGGGFNPGNSNFPTDLAATSATGTAPVVTSASYNFGASDVGHWVFIKSGTNWTPGWYKIASVASNAATLTATVGNVPLYQGATPLNTVAGCATTASPTSGTWGMDYSQVDSARVSFTDLVIGGTTTQCTSTLNPVGKNYVGNVMNVTSGTGFTTGRYEIVSTSGTTATCDRSLGTGASTGGNASLGGALASPGGAAGALTGTGGTGAAVYIKSGTYSVSNGTQNTDGNKVAVGISGLVWRGFNSVRDDFGTKPVLSASAGSITMFSLTQSINQVENLEFSGNAQTSLQPVQISGGNCNVRLCKFSAGSVNGQGCLYITGTGAQILDCEFSGGANNNNGAYTNVGPATGARFIRCTSHGNAGSGFAEGSGSVTYIRCLSYGNTLNGYNHSSSTSATAALQSVAYGNTSSGFNCNSSQSYILWSGCIAEGNGAYGFNVTTGTYLVMENCAGYNNTTANVGSGLPRINTNFQTLSGSPFTAAGSNDFTLNNTAGRGAAVRRLSYTIPPLSPTGYLDAGAYGVRSSTGGVNVGR